MDRRDFLTLLSVAAANGLPLRSALAADSLPGAEFYALPPARPGTLSLLHFTDSHAQLQPAWLREAQPDVRGQDLADRLAPSADTARRPPGGEADQAALAHALGAPGFVEAARRFGKTGGFAHLATLIARVRSERPHALLLDGGDSWQGSALALWTEGADMMAASRLLGVDAMTAHWEFTLGAERVQEAITHTLDGRIAFLARNVQTRDFGDPVFQPVLRRELAGVPIAIIGQAYPYTPIAHPARYTPNWTFGLQEAGLQAEIDHQRATGAQVVVLLSHNGLDIDLKLASRVSGLDAILGGHTHTPLARPRYVSNRAGRTLVTNAGSHGKFLAVLDLQMSAGRLQAIDYRLLPVFSQLLPPDRAMESLIERQRAPWRAQLEAPLARTDGLLYRRGTFNGSFDQLILDALLAVHGTELAFSPGFRWGTTLLPGDLITRERLLDQTAIRYPATTVRELSGTEIKALLEDVADNVFHPDPYYRQGGDMMRVAGLRYRCDPAAPFGQRISALQRSDGPLQAHRRYRVAGWASIAEPGPAVQGPPVWEVVETWLRAHDPVPVLDPAQPELPDPRTSPLVPGKP